MSSFRFIFFFKQKTAYEIGSGLVGSEMCIRDRDHAKQVARRIRAGQISINGGARGPAAPFGGFKTSGNGREHGMSGLMECLETKAIIGN